MMRLQVLLEHTIIESDNLVVESHPVDTLYKSFKALRVEYFETNAQKSR